MSNVKKNTKTKNKRTKLKVKVLDKKKIQKIADSELAELFCYLDNLLECLPEAKIKDFAKSKYYDKYISIINRLGIG